MVGGPLDFARAEDSVALAVNEEDQHHVGRHLRTAAATFVDAEVVKGKALGGFDAEVDKVVIGYPRKRSWNE